MSNLSLVQGRTRSGNRVTLLVNDDGSLPLGNNQSNSSQSSLYEHVINSPDLVKFFEYQDIGTGDERVIRATSFSPSIGASFTDTYSYEGEPGKYRITQIQRRQNSG